MRTVIAITANVAPLGFLPWMVNGVEATREVGMPEISPVSASSDRPAGRVTPSSRKNSVMMFLNVGLPEVPSTPITNTMVVTSYTRSLGLLYVHLSVFTSPNTPP